MPLFRSTYKKLHHYSGFIHIFTNKIPWLFLTFSIPFRQIYRKQVLHFLSDILSCWLTQNLWAHIFSTHLGSSHSLICMSNLFSGSGFHQITWHTIFASKVRTQSILTKPYILKSKSPWLFINFSISFHAIFKFHVFSRFVTVRTLIITNVTLHRQS